jgi:hypothetical protein
LPGRCAAALTKAIERSAQLSARYVFDWINMAILPLSANTGNAEVIVTLAGALDGPLRNALPFSVQPSDPDRSGRLIRAAAASLRPEVSEALRRRGQSMTYYEVMEYTLGHLRVVATT